MARRTRSSRSISSVRRCPFLDCGSRSAWASGPLPLWARSAMARRSLDLTSPQDRAIAQYESHYFEHGWVLVELPRPEVIQEVRAVLQDALRELSGYSDITLERYHEIADDDAAHHGYQVKLTELFRTNRYA